MLSILLIVLYSGSLLFLLNRITRPDRTYLSFPLVAAGFLMKILLGMVYGYLFLRFYGGDDTWKYHLESIDEYHHLLQHPLQFFRDTFTQTGGSLSLDAAYSTTNSFWSDFEEVLFIRMLVLFDVLSRGNYYVNVVLFSFLSYFGHLLLFRLAVSYFPRSAPFLRWGVFFYPVVLFWLSGIRKEGLLLLGLAALLYYFSKIMQHRGSLLRNGFICLASLALLWLIRNLVVLCVIPALLCWFLRGRTFLRGWQVYALVYILCGAVFFYAGRVLPLPNMAEKFSERQYSFLALNGQTRLPLDSLGAHLATYLRVLPQALNHSFLQPTLWQSKSILQVFSALDVFLFFGFGAVCWWFRAENWKDTVRSPLFMTLLLTALAGYAVVGYIVPFPGAIVRYKSLFELLLVTCWGLITSHQQLPVISNLNIWKNQPCEK